KRRAYVGSWLPSPVETGDEGSTPSRLSALAAAGDPEAHYGMLESVSFAFLLALEVLSPRQRAVLLLCDVFDYSARDAGAVLGLSPANIRIVLHRARRAMQRYDRKRGAPTAALQEQTRHALEAFLRGLIGGDVAAVETLLAQGVRTVTDGGGEYNALRVPMV